MKKTIITTLAILFWATGVSAHFDQSLSYGMSGTRIQELQEFLATQNCFDHEATGYFGFITLSAVRCFQGQNSIPTTGYFGILSRTAANKIADQLLETSTDAQLQETGTTTLPSLGSGIVNPPIPAIISPSPALPATVAPPAPSFSTSSPICRIGDTTETVPFTASNYQSGSIVLRSDHGYGAKYDLNNPIFANGFSNLPAATYTYAITLDTTPINGSFVISACAQ